LALPPWPWTGVLTFVVFGARDVAQKCTFRDPPLMPFVSRPEYDPWTCAGLAPEGDEILVIPTDAR